MTVAPEVERQSFENFTDAVQALRARGLRLSTSRQLVLRALFAAEGPVSAEYLARSLRIELTSVYRNLETLERHGLVRHVHLGHGPGLYVLVGQGEPEYLYCERCGRVRALEPRHLDPIRRRIRKLTGYHARFTHFAIVGTCEECAHRPPSTGGKPGGKLTHTDDQHRHAHPHNHEHSHADGTVRGHAHTDHEPEHVEHEHEHSHGDYVHSHPHVHEKGLEDQHDHGH